MPLEWEHTVGFRSMRLTKAKMGLFLRLSLTDMTFAIVGYFVPQEDLICDMLH